MPFLMIRNPGIADPAAFTLLGVSTTRSIGRSGTIGQFGSGSKHAVALFLRNNISVTIISNTLKMDFYSKPKYISEQKFNQVCVKYSGKDIDGTNRSSNDDLGFTTEWGVADWDKPTMGMREIVANAIDSATISGGSYKDVEIKVVDSPRAKSGYTAVFLPLNSIVQECWNAIGTMFLHYSRPDLLNKKLLPKIYPNDHKNVFIYKNGVLVSRLEEESCYDYNLNDELRLDESRNATSWDVRYACAKAIANTPAGDLVKILKSEIDGKKIFESRLETSYVYDEYDNHENKKLRAGKFQAAFKTIVGDNAILCSGKTQVNDFVRRKGFVPVTIESNWYTTLQKFGISTEDEVLDGLEKDGFDICDPTPDMILAVDKVWELLENAELLNGREKPIVKGFNSVMSAEGSLLGKYKDSIVYLHTDYAMSTGLLQTALEEVVHHVTGAGDMSRDIQDYLFKFIIKKCF